MRYLNTLIALTLLISVSGCDSDDDNDPAGMTAGETPAGETPAGETPAGETPAGETPAGETPAGETPAGETPAGETPAGETPAGETPAGETPDEITAEFVAERVEVAFSALNNVVSGYCEICPDASTDCEESAEGGGYDREGLQCIVENSSAEELESLVTFYACIEMAAGESKACFDALTECDPEGWNACEMMAEDAFTNCMLDPEYDERIETTCFPSDEGFFVCDNGDEIEEAFLCDGTADCEDISDEVNCSVIWSCEDENGEFEGAQICDGNEDCADGTDETNCP